MQKFLLVPANHIESEADLRRWPAFRTDVKLTAQTRQGAHVVEPYRLEPMVACGLSSCHHAHNRGFLVALPDGSHTNVGHQCARLHFGVEWVEGQLRAIQAEKRLYDQKEKVNELIDALPELRKRHIGAHQSTRTLVRARKAFVDLYPFAIVTELCRGDLQRDPTVRVARRLSEQEREASGISQYGTDEIGKLRGLRGFKLAPDLSKAARSVGAALSDIDARDSTTLSPRDIRHFAGLREQLTRTLDELESMTNDGMEFFTEENFALLPKLLEARYETQFERIEWDFIQMTGRRLSEGQVKRKHLKSTHGGSVA